MKLAVSNWSFSDAMSEEKLARAFSTLSGVQMTAPSHIEIIKESLDNRNKTRYVYTVHVEINDNIDVEGLNKKNKGMHFRPLKEEELQPPVSSKRIKREHQHKICVVGSGPAGMFAAHSLTMSGFQVTLIERGADIPKRHKKVKTLFAEGKLDSQSNICFGEGGAGTFSDGKLTTRKNHPWIRWILSEFVRFGGPSEILKAGKPHIGSDRLRALTIQFRKNLIENGVDVHFNTKIDSLDISNHKINSLKSGLEEFDCKDGVVWACGHSARDSYELLFKNNIPIEAKPFAVGVRIEHHQDWVNRWKKTPKDHDIAADYSVVCNIDSSNSVYSFCMCPGGQIVCSSSHEGYHVVNGMSNYRRNSAFANAGLVAKVSCEDFGDNSPFAGLNYQAEIEKKAFEASNNSYLAPAQRVIDFLNHQKSKNLLPSSYQPGLTPCDFWKILPEKVCLNLEKALNTFEKKHPGFAGEQAQLIGTETRTSAPIRIPREKEGQVNNYENFYPCGEGAGYAGGIISAALDGLHIADCIKRKYYA
jgi:uncharacterized protein